MEEALARILLPGVLFGIGVGVAAHMGLLKVEKQQRPPVERLSIENVMKTK